MLPKNHRLNLTKERFTKGDSQVSERYFKLLIKKGKAEGPRIGFIVSGKVGKAVVRNSVRRALSKAVEERVDTLPVGLYLIFIAYPQAASATWEELDNSVDKAFTKI